MLQKNICIIIFLIFSIFVHAEEKVKLKFSSRGLLDITASNYGKDSYQAYFRIEDFRAGFKAKYKRCTLKADIGYGSGKFKIKDLMFIYHFKNNNIVLGNAYEPFSLDMIISTMDLRFNQSAGSVLAFTNSRRLGITYHHFNDYWYLATGLYTNNDVNSIGKNQKNSFISTSRINWRKHISKDELFHAGIAYSITTKEVNTKEPVTGSLVNPGITAMFDDNLQEALIPNMEEKMKGCFELLYMAPKWLIQSEYFIGHINRTNAKSYHPHGGYVQGSYLVKGRGFVYEDDYDIPGHSQSDSSIELVLRFNYSNLNDSKSQVFGGEEKDLSLGINYYINKYFGIKANGSYVWVGEACKNLYQKNFFLPQIRCQYIF